MVAMTGSKRRNVRVKKYQESATSHIGLSDAKRHVNIVVSTAKTIFPHYVSFK